MLRQRKPEQLTFAIYTMRERFSSFLEHSSIFKIQTHEIRAAERNKISLR